MRGDSSTGRPGRGAGVYFKLFGKAVARFEEKTGVPFHRIERNLQGRSKLISFTARQKGDQWQYNAWLPLPEQLELSPEIKLNLQCGPDKKHTGAFFVSGMRLAPFPDNAFAAKQKVFTLHLHHDNRFAPDEQARRAFEKLLDELRGGAETYDAGPSHDEEFARWKSYVRAMRRLLQEKTIALQVKNPRFVKDEDGARALEFDLPGVSRQEEYVLWQKIRRQEMKFLSETQKRAWEREAAGAEGSFDGGVPLGSAAAIRKGKIQILTSGRAPKREQMQEGWLLPFFVAELAVLHRLEYALNVVRDPRRAEGLPINDNLRHFIFDAGHAARLPAPEAEKGEVRWRLPHPSVEHRLNERQQEAVWKALEAEDLALIQGPPGTGKTTVIAEIIWQMLQRDADAKILIASQSHLAVDNALERLYSKDLIRPLRIAAGARSSRSIEQEGLKYFDRVIEQWAAAPAQEARDLPPNAVSEWMARTADASAETDETQFSDERKAALAEWRALMREPDPETKQMFRETYIRHANIVAATCLECGRRDFKTQFAEGFDCVIIDEASKATPPELLVPLILGRKMVVIGDHKQLPPMLEDQTLEEALAEAGEGDFAGQVEDMKISQFEKLFETADNSVKVTLNTQYRMHGDIMEVINPFYREEGGLVCGIHDGQDAPGFSEKASRFHGLRFGELLRPETHAYWIDVRSPEISHRPSFSNDGEADAVSALLEALTRADGFSELMDGLGDEEKREIGVISFYGQQVEKLWHVLRPWKKRLPIRLRTVDRFQGMEREIIIVSTVRSSSQLPPGKTDKRPRINNSIGFARDTRRLNVALSRARRLLFVVGDAEHFAAHHPAYGYALKAVERRGGRIPVEDLHAALNQPTP